MDQSKIRRLAEQAPGPKVASDDAGLQTRARGNQVSSAKSNKIAGRFRNRDTFFDHDQRRQSCLVTRRRSHQRIVVKYSIAG
jgi:hypothetical protein